MHHSLHPKVISSSACDFIRYWEIPTWRSRAGNRDEIARCYELLMRYQTTDHAEFEDEMDEVESILARNNRPGIRDHIEEGRGLTIGFNIRYVELLNPLRRFRLHSMDGVECEFVYIGAMALALETILERDPSWHSRIGLYQMRSEVMAPHFPAEHFAWIYSSGAYIYDSLETIINLLKPGGLYVTPWLGDDRLEDILTPHGSLFHGRRASLDSPSRYVVFIKK